MNYVCDECGKSFESDSTTPGLKCVDCRWQPPTSDEDFAPVRFIQEDKVEKTMDPKSLASIVTGGGFVGLLAFVLVAGYQGWWVYGTQYNDVKFDRDQWKALAISATQAGEKLAPKVHIMGADAPKPELGDSAEAVAQRVETLKQTAINKEKLERAITKPLQGLDPSGTNVLPTDPR